MMWNKFIEVKNSAMCLHARYDVSSTDIVYAAEQRLRGVWRAAPR